jgi:hypothetical protein
MAEVKGIDFPFRHVEPIEMQMLISLEAKEYEKFITLSNEYILKYKNSSPHFACVKDIFDTIKSYSCESEGLIHQSIVKDIYKYIFLQLVEFKNDEIFTCYVKLFIEKYCQEEEFDYHAIMSIILKLTIQDKIKELIRAMKN